MTTTPQSPDRNAAADVLADLADKYAQHYDDHSGTVDALTLAAAVLRGEPVGFAAVKLHDGKPDALFSDRGSAERHVAEFDGEYPMTVRSLVYGDTPSPAAAQPERAGGDDDPTVLPNDPRWLLESIVQYGDDTLAERTSDRKWYVTAVREMARRAALALEAMPAPGVVSEAMDWPLSVLARGNWREVHVGHRAMQLSVTYEYATWERLMQAMEAAALNAPPAADGMVVVPKSNDGKEQDAFEEWARGQGYAMDTHPIHWLFLDSRTAAARDGWRSALDYVTQTLAAAPRQDGAEGVG